MTATPGYAADILNAFYIVLALAIGVFIHKLFRTRPLGIVGDVAVAALGIAAFAFYLGQGWFRLLLELNDDYPAYFALAYMPLVAFVATGFLRAIAQYFPDRAAQPAMSMPLAQSTLSLPPLLPAQRAVTMPPPVSMAIATTEANASPGPAEPVSSSPGGPPDRKPPSKLMKVLKVGVSLVLLLIFALIILGKFVTRNDLPGCQAQDTTNLLSNLFKAQNLDVKRYDGFTTRSTDKDLISCTADMTMMDNSAKALDYQISRLDGGRFQVKIDALRNK